MNSQNGEPIQRAQVVLIHFSDDRHAPVSWSAFTDSSGAFRFSTVPAGHYVLSAEKPGFQADDSELSDRRAQLTASREGVRLKLTRLGVLTGKVVDQTGQPIRGVNMIALSQQIVDGMRQTQAVRSVTTDDRGMYRMWNFTPEKYFVKAAGKGGATLLYAGETAPRYLADEAFALTYFGGGETLDTAQAIQMEAGTEARADLNLTLKPAHKIRGLLGNFVPRRTVKFELLSGDEDVSASRVSVNGDTGAFEIQDVLAGTYTVRVTQGEARGEQAIIVGEADVNGLAVQLSPAVDIQIHWRQANPPKESEADRPLAGRIRGGACNVTLHPPGRRMGPSIRAQPASSQGGNGEMLLPGVLPGAYRAAIHCYGNYARTVTYGTQDLLANPVLTVPPGTPPPPIEIVAVRGGGTIQGTLKLEGIQPAAPIAVLLVPQFGSSTGPETTFSDGSGQFQTRSMAPGPYAVYAFTSLREVEFRNPAFLESLPGGVDVQVEDNQEKKITITRLVQ
ncbi:MAG: carboxypeptidase-like regulatory domain-containing protein [Acidobacteriota bacterium]|nr:carboxypeptidase-like regulatory domain-containing protein [Acidobacteriota bacterium]